MLVQEQLEEVMQELEDLRIKYDALKADNSTLLAERKSESAGSPAGHVAADANGDAGPHAAPEAARDAAALSLGTAQLEVCLMSSVAKTLRKDFQVCACMRASGCLCLAHRTSKLAENAQLSRASLINFACAGGACRSKGEECCCRGELTSSPAGCMSSLLHRNIFAELIKFVQTSVLAAHLLVTMMLSHHSVCAAGAYGRAAGEC